MPCKTQIKNKLTDQVYQLAVPGLGMSQANANALTADINRSYGIPVVRFIKYTTEDIMDMDINIPQSLVEVYYENELKLEAQELQESIEDARQAQQRDAQRAGISYTDEYLFENSSAVEVALSREGLERRRDRQIAEALGEKYTKAFNIPYEIITEAQAIEILSESPTPYQSNIGSFFYGNRVYFVDGKFKAGSVVHEYAHPLVKGIQFQNPKLFDNLFNQLSLSETGKRALQIVKDRYPELGENTVRFKEEAIVTGIELDANKQLDETIKDDNLFQRFITNVMAAIKKVMRALSTKISLKALNSNTTRDQLVDMLLDEDFVIEDLEFQLSLIPEFKKEAESFLQDLEKAKSKELMNVIDRYYDNINFQLGKLRKSPEQVKSLLEGKVGEDILKNIESFLSPYIVRSKNLTAEEVDEVINAIEESEEDTRLRSIAFVNSLAESQVYAQRIKEALDNLIKTKRHLTPEGITQVIYYRDVLAGQAEFFDEAIRQLKLPRDTPIIQKILSVKQIIKDDLEEINDVMFEFSKEFINEATKEAQKNINELFIENITRILQADGFKEADINKFLESVIEQIDINNKKDFKESELNALLPKASPRIRYILRDVKKYVTKHITPDTIHEFLTGYVQDMGQIGSNLVMLGNIDDVLGAVFNFMKDRRADTNVESQQQLNVMADGMLPFLEKVGWNPNNTTKLGDILLFKDKVKLERNGELVEKEVYSFIDKFKNYRADKTQLEYNLKRARETKDQEVIDVATEALWEFHEKYMNRAFTPEVYQVLNMFKQENTVIHPETGEVLTMSKELSMEAYRERKKALETLNTQNKRDFTELDDLFDYNEASVAKMSYEELYSVIEPTTGDYKQGDDLKKVLLRIKYRNDSRKFYDFEINYERVQRDLDNFVNVRLAARGITADATPERFETELDRYLRKNFRVAYTEDYYKELTAIFNEIARINAKASDSDISKRLASLYDQRKTYVNMVTDKDGEPNALNLDRVQIDQVKVIEDEIVSLQAQFDKASGLTKEEAARLQFYEVRYISKGRANELSEEDKLEYYNLSNKANKFGLSKQEMTNLRNLYTRLSELTDVIPTDYYFEAFNTAVNGVDVEEINFENADEWINSDNVVLAKAESERFSEWFDRNHYEKMVFNPETKKYEKKFFRTKVWSVSRPSNPKYYKKTELVNPATKEKLEVSGIPVSRYTISKIKDQYRTGYNPKTKKVELEVGVHINNKGEFLPREYNEGAANSAYDKKYMNEKYYRLKNSNNAEFKLLEKTKQELLAIQEGAGGYEKVYLDLPRFRKRTNLERGQSGDISRKAQAIKGTIKDIRASFREAADDEDKGFNAEIDPAFVPTDMDGNPISRIPVRGLFALDVSETSTDVLRGMGEYMFSLNKTKQLKKDEPLFLALRNVLSDPKNAAKNLNQASSTLRNAGLGPMRLLPKSENRRLKVFNDIIEREIYGQVTDDFQENFKWVAKVSEKLMGLASLSFYALDIQSAMKNRFGMTVQKMILASGGRLINTKSLATGKIKAIKAMTELTTSGVYERGAKSFNMQMIDAFDLIPGRAESDFAKSLTRTILSDASNATFLYDFRRWVANEASLELGYAVLDYQMIEQKQPNGKSRMIPYSEAFEIGPDKILKLKDGINPEYSMTQIKHNYVDGETYEDLAKRYNTTVENLKDYNKVDNLSELDPGTELIISNAKEFKNTRRKLAGVNKKLNGYVTSIDNPTLSKNLFFKLFTYSRNYATGMFLQRFQFDTAKDNFFGEVYDWDLDTTSRGYYITGTIAIINLVRDFKKYKGIMTPEEVAALKQMLFEFAYMFLLFAAVYLIFGYDPGDEDRFNKLEGREDGYGNAGWMANQILYQLIMVKRENESFIPIPGVGYDDYTEYIGTSTIALGPTLELYEDLAVNIYRMSTGSEKAYYKQDVGPYSWQEKGSAKIWNNLAGVFGIKGKNVSPMWAIKKAEMAENLK
jgi:hypothetical protein